jgi:penicillin-binding protein 2
MYKPVRVGMIFVFMIILITIYIVELFRIQIYETRAADVESYSQKIVPRNVTLQAARGNIYDRNGILLASGRPSYNIMLNRNALRLDLSRNAIIKELIDTAMGEDVPYNDTFPITRGAPFEYISDMSETQRSRLDTYLDYFSLDPEISSSNLLGWMRTHYEIDYTIGILEARLIIGVRYELEIRAIIGNIAPYVFAGDVSSEFVTIIEERHLTGVSVESNYIREYHTNYAAHLLGYIGSMSSEEYKTYKELGYPMDAMVGKIGAEMAFENLLHGVAGKQVIRSSEDGTVMDVTTEREPEPGKHIYLTMDIDLQMTVEHELRTHIETVNQKREEEDLDKIPGGAVVVTDVHTGEMLAAASYPTFNRATLSQDWTMLNTDQNLPMLNRATQGRYSPGSTFKMITAFAGLRHGIIGRYTEIYDAGKYTKWTEEGYAPSCWIYSGHGLTHGYVNVVDALECSCNYFFFFFSDRCAGCALAGAGILSETAQEFGLGRSTGLEIPENTGRLATPAWRRKALNSGWYVADTLMMSFGQGDNVFTPVQLANYAATIANGGTLHSLSILRRVKSSDFTELLYAHEPEVLNEIEEKEYVAILQEGMKAVSRGRRGTARAVFGDYPIRVASKTGTVQVDEQDINNAVFVCYAPANNPEIAISIVIEKGGSGAAVMDIARRILDYYFISEITVLATPFGELVP